MPTYEYRCAANGRVVEVQHKMAESVSTWGELCERAGVALGTTDPTAPVQKLMSAGFINTGRASAQTEPYCDSGACTSGDCESGPCGGGFCGLQ
jgi:predicted nucleic acid-binding Zn ribbon protein